MPPAQQSQHHFTSFFKMLTGPKGAHAKLLDFGLAKIAVAPGSLAELATRTHTITGEGAIVGTFQYMAPEQLEGKPVDARTDIFAFGAVLYETITGQKAFRGESRASLISAILSAEPPPISSLQPVAPPALDRVIRKCLAKDPEDRWQTTRDLVSELKWIAESSLQAGAPTVPTAQTGTRLVWAAVAVLGLALVAALAVIWTYVRQVPAARPPVRFTVTPPAPYVLNIAYGSTESRRYEIFIQDFPQARNRVQISREGGTLPQWRADGKELFYLAGSRLMAVDIKPNGTRLEAGVPHVLFEAPFAAWGRNVFVPSRDGQRFLAILQVEQPADLSITVELNWMSRLKQ